MTVREPIVGVSRQLNDEAIGYKPKLNHNDKNSAEVVG